MRYNYRLHKMKIEKNIFTATKTIYDLQHCNRALVTRTTS